MTTFGKLMAGVALAALTGGAALAQTAAPTPMQPATQETAQAKQQSQSTVLPEGADAALAENGAAATPTTKVPEMMRAALEVESQTVADGQVTIDMAWMPEAGFVVLHPVVNGQLSPDAVGHAALAKGDNEAVTITLSGEITQQTPVVAMLHRDTGTVGTYEFGQAAMDVDQPETIGGRIVAASFMIAPQQVTPATGGATAQPSDNG